MPEATPWGAWLLSALSAGIAPDAFWRLSLTEWRALCAWGSTDHALNRAHLDELMKAYPDRRHG